MKIPDIQGQNPVASEQHGYVLRMTTNERTAGSIPVWEKAEPAQNKFEELLSYQEQDSAIPIVEDDQFGWADVIDMVNPLQHVPLLNQAYRAVTGDEIKPICKIIGGAVFGGPVGAGTGIVDAIVVEETGKDMAGNVLALAEGKASASSVEKEKIKLASAAYERVRLVDERSAGYIVRYS